jgi:glycosyltransferase involved in cell wall biosynthesis
LSVAVITRNEEGNIERCLRSVLGLADDMVVVDSGSEDRTTAIAEGLGARVIIHPWEGFPRQKQFAAGEARGDYVLMLDADEELSPALRNSLQEALRTGNADGYSLNRKTFYLGKFLEHTWHPEWRLRMFRHGAGRFEGDIHERVVCAGRIVRLRGDLHHYSYKNLRDQILRLVQYADQAAGALEKEGTPFRLVNLLFNPCWACAKVLLRGGWRDGYRGFLVAVCEGVYTALKYAFLLERALGKRTVRDVKP